MVVSYLEEGLFEVDGVSVPFEASEAEKRQWSSYIK